MGNISENYYLDSDQISYLLFFATLNIATSGWLLEKKSPE